MQPALDKHYPWDPPETDMTHRPLEAVESPPESPLGEVDAKFNETVEAAETAEAVQDEATEVGDDEFDETSARVQLLATSEPFDLFEERWLEVIAGLMVEESYDETENIYTAGELSDAAYVVSQGEVAIFSDTVGEPVQLFARLKPGEIFGEVGVLDRCRRVASARASKNTKVLRLEGCDLQRLGRANPNFGLKLAQRALLRYMRESSKVLQLGRRSDVRVRTGSEGRLIAGDREPLQVEIENLSIGGCCLRGVPETWHLNESTPISLRLNDNSELLRTRGRIAWRKGTSVGVAFTGISRSHGRQIDEALRRLLEPPAETSQDAQELDYEEALAWEPKDMPSSVS